MDAVGTRSTGRAPPRSTRGCASPRALRAHDGRGTAPAIDRVVSLTDPDAALPDTRRIATWESPEAFFDDLPSAVFDIAIDYRGGETALVYVAVRRVGVMVLRFDPDAPNPLDVLTEVERIQTAEYTSSVHVREYPTGVRHLIVSDYGGGIRVYEKK